MGKWCVLLGGLALAIAQFPIYFYAPIAQGMGITQKIFYFHLPLAIWAFISFFVVFVGSLLVLFRNSHKAKSYCQAGAELGVLFSGLALLCGMIWARQAWGVWWTWDPRLTSTLVMWLIYGSYLVLGTLDFKMAQLVKIRAVIGVIAFLDVPLVFISARLFRSVHPAVLASEGGSLELEMAYTLIITALALGFFWLGLLFIRKNQIECEMKIENLSTGII